MALGGERIVVAFEYHCDMLIRGTKKIELGFCDWGGGDDLVGNIKELQLWFASQRFFQNQCQGASFARVNFYSCA